MDHASDAEENAFYAQLTRQILLLTDEDDDYQLQTKKKGVGMRFNHTLVGGGRWSLMPGNYFSWSEGGEVPVPRWLERLWAANGGGTGVFIPHGHGHGHGHGVPHRSRRRHNNNNNKPRKNNDRGRAAGHKNL